MAEQGDSGEKIIPIKKETLVDGDLVDPKIGMKRKFSFSDKKYIIQEVLDGPDVQLLWHWDSGNCPHCKKKIVRDIEHDFYRIEVLYDDQKSVDDCGKGDIILLGDSYDNRRMKFPLDKYDEILIKTKKFKTLSKLHPDNQ